MSQLHTTIPTNRLLALLSKRHTPEIYELMVHQYNYDVSAREVRIPSSAYNASPEFTRPYGRVASVALPLDFEHGSVRGCRHGGGALEKEMQVKSLAKLQGWRRFGYDYGTYIHELIAREIQLAHANASPDTKHAFYLYNPDTVWHASLEQGLKATPLPDTFGGYSADLDAIFLLMWTNRQTLIGNDERDGRNTVFHLLLPSYHTYTIKDPFTISPRLGPLIIKGYRYGGQNMANFHFRQLPDNVTLSNVGNDCILDGQRKEDMRVTLVRTICGAAVIAFLSLCLLGSRHMITGVLLLLTACLLFPGTIVYLVWKQRFVRSPRLLGPNFEEPDP